MKMQKELKNSVQSVRNIQFNQWPYIRKAKIEKQLKGQDDMQRTKRDMVGKNFQS